MDNDSWLFPEDLPFDSLFDSDGDGKITGFESVIRDEHWLSELEDEEKAYGAVVWHPNGYFAIDHHFGKCDLLDYNYRPLGEMLYYKMHSGKLLRFVVLDNIHDYKKDDYGEV